MENVENVENNSAELFPPYVMLYNKLKALFGDDVDLDFSRLDNKTKSATISSSNKRKLEALENALDLEKFASVGFTVNFNYVCDSSEQADTIMDIFRGNPHFSRVHVAHDAMGGDVTICYFEDETLQYSADDRFVPGGYQTRLAEQLIPELFTSEARRMKYVTEPKFDADWDEDDEDTMESECDDCSCNGTCVCSTTVKE